MNHRWSYLKVAPGGHIWGAYGTVQEAAKGLGSKLRGEGHEEEYMRREPWRPDIEPAWEEVLPCLGRHAQLPVLHVGISYLLCEHLWQRGSYMTDTRDMDEAWMRHV